MNAEFNIYGDNIVECDRLFRYICSGLDASSESVAGPIDSATCPVYIVDCDNRRLRIRFLPGYGESRWNQDILGFIEQSGGLLREAADAILTRVEGATERPLAAIEFCGALPAGNQAWQRHGRAFSLAHARIPYFFVAELGGFELDANRERKAPRMPNAAAPFSLLAMTAIQGSVCLPVYEPNAGAASDTIEHYDSVFGQHHLHEFLRLAMFDRDTARPVAELRSACLALVKLLAESKERQDGLTAAQWQEAYDVVRRGGNLLDFLTTDANLRWRKTTSITLTGTARRFMDIGARLGLGLTSSSLPLSFVPKNERRAFAGEVHRLYPDLSGRFVAWLARSRTHLAIAWLNGFKPRGEDARPDRGLPPMARMLAGTRNDVLTFVYGPVPVPHWQELARSPKMLAGRNGLWEAILRVSDRVLIDSTTKPNRARRGYLAEWRRPATRTGRPAQLHVEPSVRNLGEQDVDTALHVAFASLGAAAAFEGMCNPPGGDWSGISFRWCPSGTEFRWLTLPRVSANGGKRPDHVFALFEGGMSVICLSVESKESAGSLGKHIGSRLSRYTEGLLDTPPSIRRGRAGRWQAHDSPWQRPATTFASAGAYLSTASSPFRRLSDDTGLDVHIDVEFHEHARRCVLHLRADTELGRSIVARLASQRWSELVTVQVSS